ncbi:MAG TPA: PhzF family phenazine biosynthesis protein [Humibacter sp.]|jgi:PhzF family phenazine biosynthesis protein|nr:PhzF family phenazine biosynthesis protein [Humibacter sp.]
MTHAPDRAIRPVDEQPDESWLPFALVDVFAERPLQGNPLAVVDLSERTAEVPDEWFRAVARETNQAETTFVLAGDERATRVLRSFTAAGTEVFGAGHNSLGAWWWLLQTGRVDASAPLTQRIGDSHLPVLVEDDGALRLVHDSPTYGALVDPQTLAAVLGLGGASVLADPAPQVVDTGAAHVMLLVADRESLDQADPDLAALAQLTVAHGAEGAYLAWIDADAARPTTHTRFFNPAMGLDEDIATGTAAGPLGAWLRHAGRIAGDELIIVQGESLGRPSRIRVTLGSDSTPSVIGGARLAATGLLVAPWTNGA